MRRAARYQPAPNGQRKSRCGWNGAHRRLGSNWRVQAENLLVGFHHSDFVSRDDLDIFRIGLEQMDLALPLVAIEFLSLEDGTLFIEFRRERIVAHPLGIKGSKDDQQHAQKNEPRNHAIGLMPSVRIAAASGAEFLHESTP